MDTQTLINILFGIIIGGTAWILRELWGAVKDLRKDLHLLETELPKEYVLKVDLDRRLDRMEEMLQRISEKLDGKVDK